MWLTRIVYAYTGLVVVPYRRPFKLKPEYIYVYIYFYIFLRMRIIQNFNLTSKVYCPCIEQLRLTI